MRVELDIFSGRPNPVWVLDTAQEAEIRGRIARLKPSSAKVSVPGLGYRGFIVHDVGEMRFYRGQVLPGLDADTARWGATDRELERWLLETGRGVIEASIYQMVRRGISEA
jgi:hypothetical protein